jgi:hypothetical protein
LLGDEDIALLKSEPERRKAERLVVSSRGFFDSKLSGSQVLVTAKRKADEERKEMREFLPPTIALRVDGSRLMWVVRYQALLGPWQFEIRIDDSTGVASYEDTTAPI